MDENLALSVAERTVHDFVNEAMKQHKLAMRCRDREDFLERNKLQEIATDSLAGALAA